MASPLIALLLSLATVGVGGGVAGHGSLRGVVVGADGRPVAGAELVAAGGTWDGDSPVELGRATADGDGQFSLELLDEPSECDRPTLWAIRGGSVAASISIDRDSAEGRPLRLEVDASPGAAFVVAGPDGRAIEGARIIPVRVAREVPEVPDRVARLASTATDRDGRAILRAFRPEEILEVRIEAAGFGVQVRQFRTPEGMADVGSKSITLIAAGKVSGRVVADDPQAVAGLTVRVTSSTGGRNGANVALAEATTDASGRFAIEAIASGSVTVRVRPREGRQDLPARVVRRNLEAGKGLDVEIPLRRGVKVTGVVQDDRDGRAIAGAVVSIIPSGPSEPVRVRTDAEGLYEAFVPSGLVGHRVLKVPAPYLCPPPFVGPRPVEVPPAIARFELPRVALTRGADIKGKVVDEFEHPVGNARVEASWTMFDGRIRAPRSAMVTTRLDGSFVLGPVAPDAEVSLVASSGEASTDDPVTVRPVENKAVALTLVEPDAVHLAGRVVGADGRGIAGASVRIWAVDRSPAGLIAESEPVEFDGSDELKADGDGRFLTPRRLRVGREYLALASSVGHVPARSRPLRPTGVDSSSFPDLVLPAEPRRVDVQGRVVDRKGRAVPGASVRTSHDGPCCRRATTDLDGRFALLDVPDHRSFLFAEAEGFRFFGLPIEPARGPFELTLTALDEQPDRGMTALPGTPGNPALARRVMAPYVDRVLSEGDHASRIRTLELLARVDPKRVLSLIEARGVDDAWFADHLRHAASCSLAGPESDERMAIVEAIRDLEWRVLAALDAADALPESARALKRECVEHALQDARAIRDPARKVVSLAKVADRLFDLDDAPRATKLLDEARPIADSLPPTGQGGHARIEFAERLARVDPAHALALTEDILDPGAFDRCRLQIARRLAGRDPAGAAKVLESLRDPRSLARALPGLCHALAPVDPTLARQLIAKARVDDPCLPAYAIGMMALAVSATDKPTATTWLREAFDRLARIAASGPTPPGASHDPAAVAAALLPVAERVDPKLVPELFWRAVSLHAPRPGVEARSDALLALLLARYDRDVARTFFEPIAARALASNESDLAPLLAASAILDPLLAVRLVEALPEAPDLTFHQPKNEARLALAAALARGTLAGWDDAVSRFLRLWTDSAPDGE
jgi:Carboxypeptidase regulatory-like domain